MPQSLTLDAERAPLSPAETRHLCRINALDRPTAALAPGYLQANIVILPKEDAADFEAFCRANPKPCPLIAVSKPGEHIISALGAECDMRTDMARYRIWQDGVVTDETQDITNIWQDDFVTFALGCSFSFENALLAVGIPLRHVQNDIGVPVYKTNIPCVPVGRFSGPLVVSMRPMTPANMIRATCISNEMPLAHGAPVHAGFPEAIGIAQITKPDYGDPTDVKPDELPVFWACGVTPQAVIAQSKPRLAITHAAGYMLVTDIPVSGFEDTVCKYTSPA